MTNIQTLVWREDSSATCLGVQICYIVMSWDKYANSVLRCSVEYELTTLPHSEGVKIIFSFRYDDEN